MDAPGLGAREHHEALKGLALINRASGAAERIAGPILKMAREKGLGEIRILDVACGGGDVPLAVGEILGKQGLKVRVTLADKSETAIGEATLRARAGKAEADFVVGEVPQGLPERPRGGGDFDVVTNSLFLHHLSEEQAVAALGAMRERAGKLLVVSDLRRSLWGWIAAWVGCRFLSRSKIVHFDGPVSVRAAYSMDEMRRMAEKAGMGDAKIVRIFPWRMLLTWERP